MSNWDNFKTTNVSYWPLVHSVPYNTNVPSWDLHQSPGNPWDDLIAALESWVDNVNANGKNLSNVGKLTGNGGLLGVGVAAPLRALHVNGVSSGGGVAVTGSSPQVVISNADTEPNTNTMTAGFVLATAAGNYSLSAGDAMLYNFGSSRGRLVIEPNYQTSGTFPLLLSPNSGAVSICHWNTPSAQIDMSQAGHDWPWEQATSGNGGMKLSIDGTNAAIALIAGVDSGSSNSRVRHAWIQSVKAGTGNLPLILNPNGGTVNIHVDGSTSDPMINGGVLMWVNEAGNQLNFRVKYSTGVVKAAALALA